MHWCRETKRQPGDRVPAWYLQDLVTEITHIRVVWIDNGNSEPGWYVVICNPPEVGRCTLPRAHDLISGAKKAARDWWKLNRERHLRQF